MTGTVLRPCLATGTTPAVAGQSAATRMNVSVSLFMAPSWISGSGHPQAFVQRPERVERPEGQADVARRDLGLARVDADQGPARLSHQPLAGPADGRDGGAGAALDRDEPGGPERPEPGLQPTPLAVGA